MRRILFVAFLVAVAAPAHGVDRAGNAIRGNGAVATFCTVYDPWGLSYFGTGRLTTTAARVQGICTAEVPLSFDLGYATLKGSFTLTFDDTSGLPYGCGGLPSHWTEVIDATGQATLRCTVP
ncbi:MAG TPA: hypothetical protein VMR79_03750 [Verrucomicrobiae bacterium]|nr:hypothetical protein [Verrucomicrobiae bacterium]